MSRAKDVRERWIAEVLRTHAVNNSCKVVLFAMYRHMTDAGRISYPRERLAAEVGFKSEQRVTDRIKEAKDAGLLDVVHPGYRGKTAIYEAMLPCTKEPRNEVPFEAKGNGLQGPFFGVPFEGGNHPAEDSKPPRSGVANARATYKSREQEPAPDSSRVERDHNGTSKERSYGSGQPLGSNCVVADPSRTEAEERGRALREAVFGRKAS